MDDEKYNNKRHLAHIQNLVGSEAEVIMSNNLFYKKAIEICRATLPEYCLWQKAEAYPQNLIDCVCEIMQNSEEKITLTADTICFYCFNAGCQFKASSIQKYNQ